MQIRLARPDEAAAIAALVQSAYRGESGRRGWTTESDLLSNDRIAADGVRAIIDGPDSAVLVGETDGRLVVCAELRRHGDHTAYFGMFAVDPDQQTQGVGRQFLAAAEDFAVNAWSADSLRMQVIDARTELIQWYERRGYRLTGETIPMPAELLAVASRADMHFVVLAKPIRASGDVVALSPITAADRPHWSPLWHAYLEFYQETLPEQITTDTFERLVADRELHGVLARDADGSVVGLVHWLYHPSTWSPAGYCYLEDLYVDPAARTGGVGRALIRHVVQTATEHGAEKVYWLTQRDNETARRLYDRVATDTGFVHYEVATERGGGVRSRATRPLGEDLPANF